MDKLIIAKPIFHSFLLFAFLAGLYFYIFNSKTPYMEYMENMENMENITENFVTGTAVAATTIPATTRATTVAPTHATTHTTAPTGTTASIYPATVPAMTPYMPASPTPYLRTPTTSVDQNANIYTYNFDSNVRDNVATANTMNANTDVQFALANTNTIDMNVPPEQMPSFSNDAHMDALRANVVPTANNVPRLRTPRPTDATVRDASRDNGYNTNMYAGIDTTGQYNGVYTNLDYIHDSTSFSELSENPMDDNWGGILYTKQAVDSGKYDDNLVIPYSYNKEMGVGISTKIQRSGQNVFS